MLTKFRNPPYLYIHLNKSIYLPFNNIGNVGLKLNNCILNIYFSSKNLNLLSKYKRSLDLAYIVI